jgi:hypothetical protein
VVIKNKMNILYKITYLPHLKNQTPPYYYVGSKYNYDNKYFGSPSSKQKDWYTGDLTICKWWKQKIKTNKDDFYFEIILEYDQISPKQLVEEEKKIHMELDVKNSKEYFNKSVATSGWVSVPRTDDTKKKMSRITKNYWDQNSQKALERRKELSERNRKIKSKQLKEKWKNPTDKMLKALEKNKSKLKNKSEEWIMNIKNAERKPKTAQKVFGCGTIYDSAVDASKVIGIDPVNIRRRCRSKNYQDWYYLN